MKDDILKVEAFLKPRGIASGVIGMKDYGLMNGDAILTLAIKLTEDMKENIRKEEEERVLREEKEKAAKEERKIREEYSKKAENNKQKDEIKVVSAQENNPSEKILKTKKII